MTNPFVYLIITLLFICGHICATEEVLWDLGVIVHKNSLETSQQEIDINYLEKHNNKSTHDNIKALHSNNFIEPILYEIKKPIDYSFSIIKTYDNILKNLSISNKLTLLQKSFLNKEYWKFFSLHKILPSTTRDQSLGEMYVQNLYYSKQTEEALEFINTIQENELTDMLLLYKIKILIKTKQINRAQELIYLFTNKYYNSDLLYYVQYEGKLIEIKNEN